MVKWKSRQFMLLLIALILVVMTACTSNETTTDNTESQTTSDAETAETPAEEEEVIDPLGKYDPAIEFSTAIVGHDQIKYRNGDTHENNVWTRAIQEELGITMKYDWLASGDAGEQKMNLTIASGDLPDLLSVNPTQFKQLVDAGLVADLTEFYEKYASELTKQTLNADKGKALITATVDGKLYGIPKPASIYDQPSMIWVRQDWLDKLGLQAPQTIDDVIKISEAFTKNDPDGNKKNDTYGLGVEKLLLTSSQGIATLDGFFYGHHAYPKAWIKDASGQLVYGGVQPEVKVVLQKLQQLYKDGLIDREFGVKDGGKVVEDITSGKIGIVYGSFWHPIWPLKETIASNSNAVWKAYPIVSVDDKSPQVIVDATSYQYYVVNKNSKNPEAAFKLLNLFLEKGWGESATKESYNKFYTDSDGFISINYAPVYIAPPTKNYDTYKNITAAIAANDISKLNPEELGVYDLGVKYNNGDKSAWDYWYIFSAENSSQDITENYIQQNQILINEFYDAPTPAMTKNIGTLDKMQVEVFTNIILGSPIETFDKFVEDWNNLGGKQITDEVNAWSQSKQ